MRVVRLVILLLLVVPALAFGQPKEDEDDKVSNDRPDRPLQMPPASSEVKEAFDDFERFRRRNAWERALKSLFTIPEAQALRFVDGKDGFIIPVAQNRRAVLAALSPEGQAAYRLFYDDDAKKLLEKAEGPAELKILERIYSEYFLTTVGDTAADRLGDLHFEMGRFDRAADCWLAVLHDYPDTDLSPALLSVKAALALARAGRAGEIEPLRRDLADRYADEKVTIGGRTASATESLKQVLNESGPAPASATPPHSPPGAATVAASSSEPELKLAESVPADWQMRFGESVVAGMTPQERTQWDSNRLSGSVPAVTVEGNTLYANYLGYVFALDLETGKLLWRSGAFHNLDVPAAQDQARMLDLARFAIMASKEHVWTLSRDLADPNQMAPFRLTCRRADGGDVVWQSTNLPDYAQLDLFGTPLLANGTVYVVAKPPMNYRPDQAHQYVLAVRAYDGKLRWKTEVGTLRQGQRYYYYGMPDDSPQPRLIQRGGSLYVDTHIGVLARLDAESGELEWGYGYKTDPVESSGRFFFFGMMQPSDSTSSSTPLRSGEALFVKGAKSERIYALDADRRKKLWDRPIAKSARLVGANDRMLFLGGPELSALDLQTRTLSWATRVPGGSSESRVLVRPGGIWQLTARGIFELDPDSGRVRRIFRGDDTGSDGGDLYVSGRHLVAVSNRTIAAYPLEGSPAGGPARVDEGPTKKTRTTDD